MLIRQRQHAQILGALSLLLLTACLPVSGPFNLYPINSTTLTQPIPCKLKLHFGWQTITITATLPTGGVYSGSFPTNATAPNRDLASYWDQVFGSGYFNAKVLGSPKHVRATLQNGQGDKLQLEMHSIPGDTKGGGMEGVAVDSNKDLYKAGY